MRLTRRSTTDITSSGGSPSEKTVRTDSEAVPTSNYESDADSEAIDTPDESEAGSIPEDDSAAVECTDNTKPPVEILCVVKEKEKMEWKGLVEHFSRTIAAEFIKYVSERGGAIEKYPRRLEGNGMYISDVPDKLVRIRSESSVALFQANEKLDSFIRQLTGE